MAPKVDMTIKMGPKCFPGIRDLEEGRPIDEAQIHELLAYVDARHDCADFRMVSILRALYAYADLLSKETLERMEHTVLHFKYWMDEPGEDSMCYWSENHQILFAVCEYLAGQLYPDGLFLNGAMTGEDHRKKAGGRILRWLQYRFEFGFTEWHSNTYYEEDIAPLALLVDFCRNPEMVLKAKMILDLLLLDMALHSWRGLFCAASGRCYEIQKKHPLKQDTLEIAEAVWGFGHVPAYDDRRLSANFLLCQNYDLPEVIRAIGRDAGPAEIKDSMGLNLSEVQAVFSDPEDMDTTGMFLWGMESFTNPESIKMALRIFNAWKLHRNNFLKDLSRVNHPLLTKTGLLPFVVRLLNPVTQGIAIQRANTYTYKTQDFMLSTAQRHHPGTFGDQQHIWQATLSPHVTVFATHPGAPAFEDPDRNFSPDYWVGSGIFPHAVQHRQVHMSLYDLRKRRGFMEKRRLRYTHAYFPRDKFDEVHLSRNYAFGRLGTVYIGLIGRYDLCANPEDAEDLCQYGLVTYWICELGTCQGYGSFQEFIQAMQFRTVRYKHGRLTYHGAHQYCLRYKGEFTVDGVVQAMEYDRLDAPCGRIPRRPKEIQIQFQGKSLYVNFQRGERIHSS